MALNRQEVDELLSKEEICYIATTRPDGRPHVMPIWFIYYEGKIYFETDIPEKEQSWHYAPNWD